MPIVFGRCVGRERRGEGATKEGPAPPAPARRRFPFTICRRQSSLVGAGEAAVPAVAVVSHGRLPDLPAVRKPSPTASRRCGRCRRLELTDRATPLRASSTRQELVVVVPSSSELRCGDSANSDAGAEGRSTSTAAGAEAPSSAAPSGRAKSPRRFSKTRKVHRQESGPATAGGGAAAGEAGGGGVVPQPPPSSAAAADPPSAAPAARHRHHRQQPEEDAAAVAEGGGSHTAHATSSSSTSLATWVIKRVQNLRLFQPKRDELDPEELDMLQPARCRPERLEAIRRATRFSRKEIQFVYRAFKQECPTGMVNEDTFKAIYAKFFPQGDSSQYAHYVFNTLDRNKTGTITFTDIMLSLSVLLKGSLHERIRWAFSLYDVNDDGYVTREELSEVITAIYDLIGDHQCHHHRGSNALEGEASVPETPNDHVDRMFKKLDLNHDGVITVDEFIDYCSTNDNIRSSFAVFDDLW